MAETPRLPADPDLTEDELLTLAFALETPAVYGGPSPAVLHEAARVVRRWRAVRQIVDETRGPLNVDLQMDDVATVEIMAAFALEVETRHTGASRHAAAGADVPRRRKVWRDGSTSVTRGHREDSDG